MAKKTLTDEDYKRLATESSPTQVAIKVRKMGYGFNMSKLLSWKRKNSGSNTNTNNNPEEG